MFGGQSQHSRELFPQTENGEINFDLLNSNPKQSFTHDFLGTSANPIDKSDLVSPYLKKPGMTELFGLPKGDLDATSLFQPPKEGTNFEELFSSQSKGINLKELLKPPQELTSMSEMHMPAKDSSDMQSILESKQNFSENLGLVEAKGTSELEKLFPNAGQSAPGDAFKKPPSSGGFQDMFGVETSQKLEELLRTDAQSKDLMGAKSTSLVHMEQSKSLVQQNGQGSNAESMQAKFEPTSLTKSTSMLNDGLSLSISDKTAQKNMESIFYPNYLGAHAKKGSNLPIEKKRSLIPNPK